MARDIAPLVESLGRRFAFDAPVNGAGFFAAQAGFALGDGSVAWDGGARVTAHAGATLAAAPGPGGGLVTGGDDGRVTHVTPEGASVVFDAGRGWIDQVAVQTQAGVVACAAGRAVHVRGRGGAWRTLTAPRAANALAFDSRGHRLAIAHADAVSIASVLAPDQPLKRLEWAGAHVAAAFSPDDRFLVSGMGEGAMHGWRLADGRHFQMQGFPFKPRSLSFDRKGGTLAVSGAGAALLWSFQGKDGPMGTAAIQLPSRPGLVTAVACHPRDPLLAVGYADGGTHLLRMADGADIWLDGPPWPLQAPERPLDAGTAVTCLAWGQDGRALAWGGQDGRAGVLILPG